MSPEEIRSRVLEALDLVGLEGLEARFPEQLSGSQQQRVALARALVRTLRVLLVTVPLPGFGQAARPVVTGDLAVDPSQRLNNISGRDAVKAVHLGALVKPVHLNAVRNRQDCGSVGTCDYSQGRK